MQSSRQNMSLFLSIGGVLGVVLLSACGQLALQEAALPNAHQALGVASAGKPAQPAGSKLHNQGRKMVMDYGTLIPENQQLIKTVSGDLNGDGKQDLLIVSEEKEPYVNDSISQAKRTLYIFMADVSGGYSLLAKNNKLIPCKACGGLLGDPFQKLEVAKSGEFRLYIAGGSRERWALNYFFALSVNKKRWLLQKLTVDIYDTITEKSTQKEYLGKDFKNSSFELMDHEEAIGFTAS